MAERVTQEATEVLSTPTRFIRATQDAVEVLSLPTTRNARATQCAVEVLLKNENFGAAQPIVVVVCC